MAIIGDEGSKLRAIVRDWFAFAEPVSPAPKVQVLTLVIGQPEQPGHPTPPIPPEYMFMAEGNVGERLPIVIQGWIDHVGGTPGELGGPADFEVEDESITVVEDDNGTPKARLLAQGSSKIKAMQPFKDGSVQELVGLVVVNDPADDAKIAEMTFGPAEPAP